MAAAETKETTASKGVEARGAGIRIAFQHEGRRCRETLRIPPTPKNLRYAEGLREEILRKIALGAFRLCDYFPDSPHCRRPAVLHEQLTVAELCEVWLKVKAARLAPTTFQEYRNALARHLVSGLGELPATELTFAVLSEHLAGLPIAGKTRNNVQGIIAGLVGYGIKAKHITDHAAIEAIERVKEAEPEPDPLTLEEVGRVLGYMRDRYPVQVNLYFQFAILTGLRPSESIAVEWGDVDWHRAVLRVQRARVRAKDKDTKTHSARDVELTAQALSTLKAMQRHTFIAGGRVFQNPATRIPWTDTADLVQKWWRPALKALGIRDRDARQTRHSFATTCLMAGLNPAWVARQMGHTSTKMFFEAYSRWIDGGDGGRQKAMLEGALAGIFAPGSPHKQSNNT